MKPLWEASSWNSQNVGHVLKCKLTPLRKRGQVGILNQYDLFVFLLLCISYTTVPFYKYKYTKEGFYFIKVAPQDAEPEAGKQPILCALGCWYFLLPQLSAILDRHLHSD